MLLRRSLCRLFYVASCYIVGFYPTFFTLGRINKFLLLSLNQNVEKCKISVNDSLFFHLHDIMA